MTAEDETVIQQHMKNHRKAIRNEIESVEWYGNVDDDKKEQMPSDVCDLIYEYITQSKSDKCCDKKYHPYSSNSTEASMVQKKRGEKRKGKRSCAMIVGVLAIILFAVTQKKRNV